MSKKLDFDKLSSVFYSGFKTKDKWINVGASNQNTWLMLLKAINRENLNNNEKFSSNSSRKKNLNELVEILNEELIKKPSEEWLKIFDNNGLPCGPINSITDMFKDPQTIEREMVIEVNNKKAGKSTAIGMPIKFSKSKTKVLFWSTVRKLEKLLASSQSELDQDQREKLNAAKKKFL